MAGLARECGLQDLYSTCYSQGSALTHATYWSLSQESGASPTMGLLMAVRVFYQLLELSNQALTLGIDAALGAIRVRLDEAKPE